MIYSLNKDAVRSGLSREIDWSYAELSPVRRTRLRLLEMYVGNHYGRKVRTEEEEQLINLIYQTATIYVSWLVAQRPQASADTKYNELLPFAKRLEINLNNLMSMIKVEIPLRACVLESLFKWGIAKVALGDDVSVAYDDDPYSNPGFPFVSSISHDNWVHDMQATSRQTRRWMGDYYEINETQLMNSGPFDKKTREKLWNQSRRNRETGKLAASLGSNADGFVGDYRKISLIDLWMPEEKRVYTLDANLDYKPLNVVDYSGSAGGPYKELVYDDVPDNTVPVSPLENLIRLSEVTNSLMKKNVNKANRSRSLMGFSAGNAGQAETIRGGRDGEFVQIDDPDGVVPMNIPGVDQNLVGFSIQMLNYFDRQGGNVSMLGGLGAQTNSVGQEKLLNENTTAFMQKMQGRVVDFASEVCTELAYHLWHDKVGFKASYNLDHLGFPGRQVDRSWIPGYRQGDFLSYEIKVEPTSMARLSDQEKMAAIDSTLQNVVFPMMATPMWQESGLTFDLKEYIEVASNLKNVSALRRIIKSNNQNLADPPRPDESESASKPSAPAFKKKNVYEHRSVSGRQSNPDRDVMQMMAASAANNNPN